MKRETFRVNVNNYVKVKLNKFGIDILKNEHYALYDRIKEGAPGIETPVFKLSLDERGYHRMQMWDFMNVFGEYMTIGSQMPFDANIEIISEVNHRYVDE